MADIPHVIYCKDDGGITGLEVVVAVGEASPVDDNLIKYLRADTCTPNEECVSKAELEVFIRELEGLANPDTSSDGMDLAWGATTNASLVRRDARATAYGIVAKRLREVMDK